MQGNEAVRPLLRQWLRPFNDLGAETLTVAPEILARDLQGRQPAAETALSFCLAEPAIAVALIGTTNARHLNEAIRAVGST